MENKFPAPIRTDKDLSVYESYLKRDEKSCCALSSNPKMEILPKSSALPSVHKRLYDIAYMPAYLTGMKGKLVRVESLIGNKLETRVGTLMSVGADYIVLKLFKGCSTLICESASIKYITVVHDNDMNKLGLL